MGIRIYNTLTGKKEPFEPEGDPVKMFVCGVTVYDDLHLGHVRTYLFYDFLKRFLEYEGYDVFYIQNVTDVGHLTDEGEDKILKKASGGEWHHPKEVAEFYEAKQLKLFGDLRIRRPDLMPRATAHIPEIIDDVEKLIERGYAYESNGSVYFRVRSFEDYGKLSNSDIDELREGARVNVRDEKENPEDFALWKRAEPDHIMQWSSPWGRGYPGWHIEDTAIAREYFGDQYEIHGGAIELAFPHHEAEIAQAEAASDVSPYVKYWVHTGLLTIKGEKMSKSKGNFVTAEDALDSYPPEAIRLWALSANYRSPLDYSDKALDDAKSKLDRLEECVNRVDRARNEGVDAEGADLHPEERLEDTLDRLRDDLNTPDALAEFFSFINDVNTALDEGTLSSDDLNTVRSVFDTIDEIFGIVPRYRGREEREEEVISAIVDFRTGLRQDGEYELADRIRDKLADVGIEVRDEGEDSTWYWQ